MFASNHHQVFRSSLNNENTAVLPVKSNDAGPGTVTKTPGASGEQRRALGDISNRKSRGLRNNSNNNKNSSNGAKLLKKAQTTGGNLQPRKALSINANGSASTSSKTPSLIKSTENAFLPRQSQAKKTSSSLELLLPVQNETFDKLSLAARGDKKGALAVDGLIDDIEMPAGRLWIEQLEDDIGDDTSLSLPGAATMREDWAAFTVRRHERRIQLQDENDRRLDEAYDAFVAKQLQEEGKQNKSAVHYLFFFLKSYNFLFQKMISWALKYG